METFYIEVTDTFGGEANYCWVKRFKVTAKSELGAIRKVSREMGYSFRKDWDDGLCTRYNAKGANVCAFASYYEPDCHDDYIGMKSI